MASYEVIYKSSVEKDLLLLPKSVVRRMVAQIDQLRDDPFPRQSSKLGGAVRLYRVRVGNYRIVYKVDTAIKRIIIQYVRHRREVYRGL